MTIDEEGAIHDRMADRLGNLNGSLLTTISQQKYEFLPAITSSEDIIMLQLDHLDASTEFTKDEIAYFMPVRIVDAFEMIDIKQDHGKRIAISSEFLSTVFVKGTTIW